MAQAIKMNKFFDEEFKRMLVRDKSNSERLLEDAKRVFGE